MDAWGCHGQDPAGDQNIIPIGKAKIPQVLHHMENGDLAAGNFYYVADGYNPDYSNGHNLIGISIQEDPPMDKPPAFIGNVIIPGGNGPVIWPGKQQLTCAGTWGCHGNRTVEDPFKSIYGAHALPYYKIMRWDYKSSTLSTALSGCNVCHTSKN